MDIHLVLENADAWAERFGGIGGEHAVRIRLAVTGRDPPNPLQPNRDRYWALAKLAGHASPETTFASYLHLCDLLIGESSAADAPDLPVGIWRHVTGFTANKLTRIVKAASNEGERVGVPGTISAEAMAPAIRAALAPGIDSADGERSSPHVEPPPPELVENPTEIATRALARLERGFPATTVAYQFAIDERRLLRWRDNARAIAALTTARGHPLHIAGDRSRRGRPKTPMLEITLPGRPRSHAERVEAARLIHHPRSVFATHRGEVAWAIHHALHNSDMSDSGIRFHRPEDLVRFGTLFADVLANTRWLVSTRRSITRPPLRTAARAGPGDRPGARGGCSDRSSLSRLGYLVRSPDRPIIGTRAHPLAPTSRSGTYETP